ncbi:hypothetical protein CkaCkLH20_02338 [Colletotrichum karsti]|uniref:Uncharacterized protein n=1 Tax=Colletotrichum karsti TaxID=1095194 RepID=A0A9P6ICN2_9PEZI|nr:uncharacterized protein CkaCkLH20_02338 [Colletotrichum karsti]KAF9880384.1 hypothetical protein CkaCkLH20_02338 [Colletotrichum karsti]
MAPVTSKDPSPSGTSPLLVKTSAQRRLYPLFFHPLTSAILVVFIICEAFVLGGLYFVRSDHLVKVAAATYFLNGIVCLLDLIALSTWFIDAAERICTGGERDASVRRRVRRYCYGSSSASDVTISGIVFVMRLAFWPAFSVYDVRNGCRNGFACIGGKLKLEDYVDLELMEELVRRDERVNERDEGPFHVTTETKHADACVTKDEH